MLFVTLLPLLMGRVDGRHAWELMNSIHICTLEVGWIGRDRHIWCVASECMIH